MPCACPPRAASARPLRSVVSSLRAQLSGTPPAELSEASDMLQLQFLETVMMLFEREGVPAGALLFARAALEHTAAAYAAVAAGAAGGAMDLDQEQGQAGGAGGHERRQHEGRLWFSIFSYACQMRAYEVRRRGRVHCLQLRLPGEGV